MTRHDNRVLLMEKRVFASKTRVFSFCSYPKSDKPFVIKELKSGRYMLGLELVKVHYEGADFDEALDVFRKLEAENV